ncbi:MAG: Lrp/AsnC family transcriptional regulator [Kordiimonas sp.]
MEIDNFDRKILNCLQENSRQTAEQISDLVGLSAPACQRRIKKLRQSGIIAKEVAILDPQVCGNRTTLVVQICFAVGGIETVDGFKENICQLPEVQHGYYCTGEADFIIIMTVKDMQDYDRLCREWFFGNPAIRRFDTSVAIGVVKAGFNIPLDVE